MKRKYKIIFCPGNAQSCVPKKEKNTFENWIFSFFLWYSERVRPQSHFSFHIQQIFRLRKLDIKIRSGEKDNTLLSLLE